MSEQHAMALKSDQRDSVEAHVAHALSAIVRGLTYFSESDEPYEPFYLRFESGKEVTPDALREAMGLAQWWKVVLDDGESFPEWVIDVTADPSSEDSAKRVELCELLRTMMHAAFRGPLQHAWISREEGHPCHNSRHIVFGRLASTGVSRRAHRSGHRDVSPALKARLRPRQEAGRHPFQGANSAPGGVLLTKGATKMSAA